jgi:hypothetical protein
MLTVDLGMVAHAPRAPMGAACGWARTEPEKQTQSSDVCTACNTCTVLRLLKLYHRNREVKAVLPLASLPRLNSRPANSWTAAALQKTKYTVTIRLA